MLKNIYDQPSIKWDGGVTRELFKDQDNYNIRISSAEVFKGNSTFSDFTGYKRILQILNGKLLLNNNDTDITLETNNIYLFDGKDKVTSENDDLVVDFNVIYKDDFIDVVYQMYRNIPELCINKNSLLLSIEDGFINDKLIKKFDYIIFEKNDIIDLKGRFILINWDFIKKNTF